jgi:hypothetical protein
MPAGVLPGEAPFDEQDETGWVRDGVLEEVRFSTIDRAIASVLSCRV